MPSGMSDMDMPMGDAHHGPFIVLPNPVREATDNGCMIQPYEDPLDDSMALLVTIHSEHPPISSYSELSAQASYYYHALNSERQSVPVESLTPSPESMQLGSSMTSPSDCQRNVLADESNFDSCSKMIEPHKPQAIPISTSMPPKVKMRKCRSSSSPSSRSS